MTTAEVLLTAIIIATGVISYKGFNDYAWVDRYIFDVGAIRYRKEYMRLLSSGFLHGSWWHLGFNMYAFYSFGSHVADSIGVLDMFVIYFGSLLGGSLLSLYINKGDSRYRALGASGAVSGIVYASIVLHPTGKIGLVFLPFGINSWLFGMIFLLVTLFGIRNRRDNIGHDAHLGGGIAGILLLVALQPELLSMRPLVILSILFPVSTFLWIVVKRPWYLRLEDPPSLFGRKQEREAPSEAEELDNLLDKVRTKGLGSLSKAEKQRLDELSQRL